MGSLSAWLKSKNMPANDFADRIGVHKSTVGRWLDGTLPQPEHLALIMRETDGAVTANDFMAERVGAGSLPAPTDEPRAA